MRTFLRAAQIWLALAIISPACAAIFGTEDHRNYSWLVAIGCWLAVDLYWAWAARPARAVSVGDGGATALWLTFLIYALYCLPLGSVPLLGQQIVPKSLAIQASGAVLSACGCGFAIWSRTILAGSWNAAAARDNRQALIQNGPYAIVRHPIYLGFFIAILGMILALGEMRTLALLFGVEVLLKKVTQEENLLRAAFPRQYPEYARKVKRLVPWLW